MKRKQENMLEKWVKERNEAVASFDVKKFKSFLLKWQMLGAYRKRPLPDDEILEIAMYKMCCNIVTMQAEKKQEARAWLKLRGYDTDIY